MREKMTGWIIYSSEDVKKNRRFIEMISENFLPHHVEMQLIVLAGKKEAVTEGSVRQHFENGDWNVRVIYGPEEINCFETPDFAINRSRMSEISAILEEKGVRVFNSEAVTRITNDKAKTYEFLKGVVPFMPVIYEGKYISSDCDGYRDACGLNRDFAYPYVIKSCRGHGGNQVFMIKNSREENEALREIQGEKYLRQQCCSDLGKDVRVYIIGNEIVTAILRTSTKSFKSNYSLGGEVKPYILNENEKNMVEAITKKLPLDYAGIDFTFHNGKAVFNEIEDAVGARMLYATTDIDIVKMYTEYIMQCVNEVSAEPKHILQ